MDLFQDTYSEQYRYECELRFIASMNLSGRRNYLALVLDKRGVSELERLKTGLELMWKNKK